MADFSPDTLKNIQHVSQASGFIAKVLRTIQDHDGGASALDFASGAMLAIETFLIDDLRNPSLAREAVEHWKLRLGATHRPKPAEPNTLADGPDAVGFLAENDTASTLWEMRRLVGEAHSIATADAMMRAALRFLYSMGVADHARNTVEELRHEIETVVVLRDAPASEVLS